MPYLELLRRHLRTRRRHQRLGRRRLVDCCRRSRGDVSVVCGGRVEPPTLMKKRPRLPSYVVVFLALGLAGLALSGWLTLVSPVLYGRNQMVKAEVLSASPARDSPQVVKYAYRTPCGTLTAQEIIHRKWLATGDEVDVWYSAESPGSVSADLPRLRWRRNGALWTGVLTTCIGLALTRLREFARRLTPDRPDQRKD